MQDNNSQDYFDKLNARADQLQSMNFSNQQQQQQAPQQADGWQQRLFGNDLSSPGGHFLQGAAGGLLNTPINAANMVAGSNIPTIPTPAGFAGGAGNIAGNIGGFLAGGEGLDLMRGAAEGLPYIGKAAAWLGAHPATNRTLGAGLYGAINDPNNRIGGALGTALLSGVGETIPGAAGAISGFIERRQPEKAMSDILQNIGQGRGLEDNAKSLAEDIKNTFSQKTAEGSALYQPVFDKVGNDKIYNTNEAGGYPNLDQKVLDNYDMDLKDMHNNFMDNPTFNNAHELQSQLGYNIRSLQSKEAKTGLDLSDRNEMQSLQRARSSIKGDMNQYLSRTDPDLVDQYGKANQNWMENVVPYQDNKGIYRLATGEVTNPSNLSRIFKNPEDSEEKIIGDLPGDAPGKILYSELGKASATKSPQAFKNAINQLDQKGLSSYKNPSLQDQIDKLDANLKFKNLTGRAAGLALGGTAGVAMGDTAGILGGLATEHAFPYFMNKYNLGSGAGLINKGVQGVYPYARAFGLTSAMGGNNSGT